LHRFLVHIRLVFKPPQDRCGLASFKSKAFSPQLADKTQTTPVLLTCGGFDSAGDAGVGTLEPMTSPHTFDAIIALTPNAVGEYAGVTNPVLDSLLSPTNVSVSGYHTVRSIKAFTAQRHRLAASAVQ